ncbi:MAG: hypothetical protein J2P41_12775 [Blastocatellia bacterium]|nr:hypothetical protein [Blastocatellia bacterium]
MKRVDRLGCRVHGCVRERLLVVHDGSRLAAGGLRHDESLNIEAAEKLLMPLSILIGLDVALVPGQAERRIGKLEHKEIELSIRGETFHINAHQLHWSQGDDLHVSVRASEAIGGFGRA